MAVQDQRRFVDHDVSAQTQLQLRLLEALGPLLATASSLDEVAQASITTGMELCEATAGVFYQAAAFPDDGQPTPRCVLGIQPFTLDALSVRFPDRFPPPRSLRTAVGVGDLAAKPGGSSAHVQPPPALRSYLAVPVLHGADDLLGVFVFGHTAPHQFHRSHELLLAAIAAQAGLALENLRLSKLLERETAFGAAARGAQRATERRLREALEAAQLGTWDWNSATDMVDFDERAAALFEVPAGQPFSRTDLRQRSVYEEDRPRTPQDLRQILQGGQKYNAEYRIQRSDDTQRWIASSGIPTTDETTGRFTGMTGTVKDITETRAQEEALRQSEKLAATGRLAATIAHEINNPLEAVTNLIYLAKTDPSTPPQVARMLETADAELARVAHIAQQTLVFYRDTRKPAYVDLNELLQAVVDLFSRKLANKQLECTLDLDPGLFVTGLQGELRQVVSNLLVNAIDASPAQGGSIRIRGRHRHRNGDHGVAVLISDQGTGIPAHVRHRIFSPFVTTKQAHGTGLGLWVTQGMVERHGGSLCFRSRTESPAGTVFRFYLPDRGTTESFNASTPVLQ